jgi:hypothetical protein
MPSLKIIDIRLAIVATRKFLEVILAATVPAVDAMSETALRAFVDVDHNVFTYSINARLSLSGESVPK